MSTGYFPSKRAYTYQPGSDFPATTILLWDNSPPGNGAWLTIQLFGNPQNPSSIPIREIYFPILLTPVQVFLGLQGPPQSWWEPDYITQGSGCECVDFDGVAYLTLANVSGTYAGSPIYVFARNLPTGAFRTGPVGAQVTSVTATLPIISSGGNTPNISMETPLPIADGGTGTATPQLIAGSGITITGSPFNWTIAVSGSGAITNVVAANYATVTVVGGVATVGTVIPMPVAGGGTGQISPALNAGTGISVTGTIFQPGGGSPWTVTNTGVTGVTPFPDLTYLTGQVSIESTDDSIAISKDVPNNAINITVSNPIGFTIAVVAHLSVSLINGAGETVTLPTLPTGTWFVECIVHGFGLGPPAADSGCTGNTIQITGAGWGGAIEDDIVQCQGTRTLYIASTVSAGNTPSVTVTGTGVTLNSGTTYVSLGFKAIRIS